MESLSVIKSSEHLPVSIEEAKLFLKVTNKEEDDLIKGMIEAASTSFESYTSKAILVKEWKAVYKKITKAELTLPIRHVSKVNSVTLIEMNNRKYKLHHKSFDLLENTIVFHIPPFSYLAEIRFEAGIASEPSELPSDIKESLLEHIAYLYENRSSNTPFNLSKYDQFREIKI